MASLQNSLILNRLLLIAVIGDFAVPYVLAPFYKGYRHSTMVMSLLGNAQSPVRVLYNSWLILLGVLLLAAAAVMLTAYWTVSKALTITAVLLISLFAIGAGILSGLFSVGTDKRMETLSSKIHGAGAALGFMSLLFVPLLLAILSYKNGNRTEGLLFLLSFGLAVLSFSLFVLADKPRFQHTWIRYEGLWQRLSLLWMYFPLAHIAVGNLMRLKSTT